MLVKTRSNGKIIASLYRFLRHQQSWETQIPKLVVYLFPLGSIRNPLKILLRS